MKRKIILLLMLFLVVFSVLLVGCQQPRKKTTQEKGQQEQESTMSRARAAYPTPQVDEFLTRKNVVKWMERMDQPGKIFYIYVMSDTGSITHYFVAEYRPVSVSTYLTPTKKIKRYSSSYGAYGFTYPAPALDGTYYGEGGASDQYFFFDAETDAYIELKGLNYIVSDQPFEVKAPQIKISNKK